MAREPLKTSLVLMVWLAAVAAAAGTSQPAAAAAATGTSVADLPRQPEVACASEAVYAAFSVCRVRGASQQCCDKLQAVYGERSSPAFGCLCLPAALYKTTLAASEHNVDALGLLRACRTRAQARALELDSASAAAREREAAAASSGASEAADNTPPPTADSFSTFDVEWAGHAASKCPANLKLSSGPVDILTAFGPDPILAGSWPAWGWGNLQQAGAFLVQYNHTQAFAEHLLGKRLMELSLQVFLVLPLFYLLAHHAVLRPCSSVYRSLPLPQRLVVCQHAVYAAVFGASLLPQTILAARFLFGAWTGEILLTRLWTKLVAFIMSRCGLYLVEGSVRAVKWSWVLVAHHVIFLALLAQNVRSGNPALGVVGVVLDLFAVHEFPLYVALLGYRLRAPVRFARGVLRGALAWYVLTRIAQTAILGYILAGLALLPQINRDPAFIATAAMCAALTMIQAYTVGIYRGIDRKMGKQQQQQEELLVAADEAVADASVLVGKAAAAAAAGACKEGRSPSDASVLVAEELRGGRGAASLKHPWVQEQQQQQQQEADEDRDVADCQPHSVGDAGAAGRPAGAGAQQGCKRRGDSPLDVAPRGRDGEQGDQSPVAKKRQ